MLPCFLIKEAKEYDRCSNHWWWSCGIIRSSELSPRNKTVTVFGRSLDSSLLYAAEKVDNYLGLPDMTGEDLLNQFYAHAVKSGVHFQECRITQMLVYG